MGQRKATDRPPTEKQLRVLRAIADGIRNGAAPTYREIAVAIGASSTNATTTHLQALAARDLISWPIVNMHGNSTARGVRLTAAGWRAIGDYAREEVWFLCHPLAPRPGELLLTCPRWGAANVQPIHGTTLRHCPLREHWVPTAEATAPERCARCGARLTHRHDHDAIARSNVERAKVWLAYAMVRLAPAVVIAPYIAWMDVLSDGNGMHRTRGMAMSLSVLSRCEGAILCGGRISPGMEQERGLAARVIDWTALGDDPPRDGVR